MRKFANLILCFTIVFSISVVTTGCDDETPGCVDCPPPGGWPPPNDTALAPQELLDLVYFKDSSWWVYQMQDTTKDIFDTVRVVGVDRNIYYNPQKFPFAEEQIGVFFLHSFEGLFNEGTEPDKRYQNYSILAQDFDFFSVYAASQRIDLTWSYFLTYPYLMGKNGSNFEVVDTNAILLNGNYHRSIHTKGWAELWISPHIGITKFIPPQGKTWQLVKYSIKQ
ncbi:MAG: hypothetical protein VXX46_04210 [Bacteroidota bacterium]|nr:hypothetical protein [Bacteroidota bacterium]